MSTTRRLLHFVYKIADRTESVAFFRGLGMGAIRHEEFEEGCDAKCNGPYDGKWSKTMIGYGGEDDHFVAELTYNYSVRDYDVGNSHIATIIHSPQAFKKYSTNGVKITTLAGVQSLDVTSPSGYTFRIDNRYGITRPGDPENEMLFFSENKAGGGGGVLLASSDMAKTSEFWKNVAQMDCEYGISNTASFFYPDRPSIRLSFEKIVEPINPAGNYGRTALAWPTEDLPNIERLGLEHGGTVLTPLLTLPTPGKADVVVVILADPDGHEVCFVGDHAFRQLSETDAKADLLLDDAMANDKSNEWIEKRKRRGY